MDFLFVNTQELSALTGLPHIQQVTYLMGIRPHMDRKSFVVGIKRRISYQSLSEALYIEPHPGIKSGSPSREQIRRVIKSLERAGLVLIQSSDKHLVLKCLLANADNSVQNHPDTRPTQQPGTRLNLSSSSTPTNSMVKTPKADRGEMAKADIPHNSEQNYVCVSAQFEKFWFLYPQKKTKQTAFEAFKTLRPSDELLTRILAALQQQIDACNTLQAQGQWIPKWKFPANWLEQHCWEDEINIEITNGEKHATYQTPSAKQQPIDIFWESCKSGAGPSTRNRVIQSGKS